MNRTSRVLARMLRENTGQHMLDSGGAYGRQWERNRSRDFEAEPEATLEWWEDGRPNVTLSTYHFLRRELSIHTSLDAAFRKWSQRGERREWDGFECAREWVKARGFKVEGTMNTYNGESLIDQVLQYTTFSTDDEEGLILLSIHGGCDVRGGYTFPRVFVSNDDCGFLDDARASIYCSNRDCGSAPLFGVSADPARWYTDDAWHWYRDESPRKKLEEYGVTDGICPVCGVGKLEVGS